MTSPSVLSRIFRYIFARGFARHERKKGAGVLPVRQAFLTKQAGMKHPRFVTKYTTQDTRPLILIILDGFGVREEKEANATQLAKTPTLDRLRRVYPHGELDASESHVGLPPGFMGNSEVGHLNIGAGRVVYQDFSLISHAIETGTFFKNTAFLDLFARIGEHSAALHLMGLVSDGGVHSHISHLLALLEFAKQEKISQVWIHAITDGRDTDPKSGLGFVTEVSDHCNKIGLGKIATVSGRFYAMDRDKRWERTEKAWDAIAKGDGEKFEDPVEYIRRSYEHTGDEFILPGVSSMYPGVKENDGFIFFNFRADRARQITRALTQNDFTEFRRGKVPKLSRFVCLTQYDPQLKLPFGYEKAPVPLTLGEIVAKQGWKQLRIAETEKYAHVTYFFNGGNEKEFPGETRILIPSPRDVKTYDLKPEMSAREVASQLLKEISKYQFIVVNFANPDMVGHTGNLAAAIQAIEVVDECLGKIIAWVEEKKAIAILTADHGNCEQMALSNGTPLTSHTLLRVPIMVIDPMRSHTVLNGRLSDIAPTILSLWGITQPKEMTGHSLITSQR